MKYLHLIQAVGYGGYAAKNMHRFPENSITLSLIGIECKPSNGSVELARFFVDGDHRRRGV